MTESLPLTGVNPESIECPIEDEKDEYESKEQIDNMITMSTLDEARWQSILNLDTIKARNKPTLQPPNGADAAVPFFIPTIASVDFKFDLESAFRNDDSKNKPLPEILVQTVFAQQLLKADTLMDYHALFNKLKCMGPSALNYEIRCLSPETGGTYELMMKFLELLNLVSKNNKDFELSQSYLGVFLKHNGCALAQRPDAINILDEISKHNPWDELEKDFFLCLSIVDYMKSN